MKTKVVFLDAYTLNPGDLSWSSLKKLGDVEIYDHTAKEDIVERAKNAEVVIVNKVKLTRDIIEQLTQLKFIQVAATGYNNIDLVAAKDQKVIVCNIVGYSTASVAQHVFASLLAYLNRSEKYFNESKDGRWSNQANFSYWDQPFRELKGQKFGILGFGNIGKAVAAIGAAFGCEILVYHKYPDKVDEKYKTVSLEELFEESDFLSLHAPLNESTLEIVNKNRLGSMKSSSILINTARAELIDEKALLTALEQDHLEAAIIDVFKQEPPKSDHPFLGHDKIYVTPHQAWASQGARMRLLRGIINNISTYQSSEPLKSLA